MSHQKNPKQSVDFRVMVLIVVLLASGTALTAFFGHRPAGVAFYIPILGTLGTTLVAVGVVALVWEIFIRRTFLQEILAEVGLSENLKQSGLHRVEGEFTDVDWDDFYGHAKTVKLVVFHASHTLTMGIGRAVEAAARAGTAFEVILPDLSKKALLDKLAQLEGNPNSKAIRTKIEEAIKGFHALGRHGAEVSVRISPHVHPFAMYLSDKKAILVLNPEPTFTEPVVLVCNNGGALYRYAHSHYDIIRRDSTERNQAAEQVADDQLPARAESGAK